MEHILRDKLTTYIILIKLFFLVCSVENCQLMIVKNIIYVNNRTYVNKK